MKRIALLLSLLFVAAAAYGDDVQSVFYDTGLREFQGRTRASGTVGFRQGVTDGTGPCSGCIGEEISSSVGPGTVSLSNGSPLTVTSITVPPGTWELSAAGAFQPAASTSVTQYLVIVSKTTNSIGGTNSSSYANPSSGESRANISLAANVPGANNVTTVPVIQTKITLSSATTYFLVLDPAFTVSTMAGGGTISAVRTF